MVLSHHKKLAWRRATSDNTPTRIILPQKLKRQLLSNRRLMKWIDARYWNERRYETRKNIFRRGGWKRSFEISLHSFWHDKIRPRRDLPFQKVIFWKECSYDVVWLFIITIYTRQQDLAIFQRNSKIKQTEKLLHLMLKPKQSI